MDPPVSNTFSFSSGVTKRWHLSPLSQEVHTPEAIRSLLSPHGQVLSLAHWPPPINAVGEPYRYAFVTIRGDKAKLEKAVARISGSVWKGRKIWIREAKRDYQGKYGSADETYGINQRSPIKSSADAAERLIRDTPEEKAKRKAKLRRSLDGVEHDWVRKKRVITEEDVKAGKMWGWRVTSAGHLLRPIQMRPDRPILPLTSEYSKKPAGGPAKDAVPQRARLQLIDPARYGAVHLSGSLLSDDDTPNQHELWVCEEVEKQEGPVKWVRLSHGAGSVREVEEIKLPHHITKISKAASNGREELMDPQASQQQKRGSTVKLLSQSPSPSPSSPLDSDSESSATSNSAYPLPASSRFPFSSSSSSTSVSMSSLPSPPIRAALNASPLPVIPDLGDGSFAFQTYDPNDEANFSDGYEERGSPSAHKGSANQTKEATSLFMERSECERSMQLLKDLFGSGVSAPLELGGKSHDAETLPSSREEGSGEHEEEGCDAAWWTRPAKPVDAAAAQKEPKAAELDSDATGAAEDTTDKDFSRVPQKSRKRSRREDQVSKHFLPAEPSQLRSGASRPVGSTAKVNIAPADTFIDEHRRTQPSPHELKDHPSEVASRDGPSRRAALLAKIRAITAARSSGDASNQFTPFPRFEPATVALEVPAASNVTDSVSDIRDEDREPAASTNAVNAPAQAIQVKVSRLKDMFKPQEASGGFSLMSSLSDLVDDKDLDESMIGFGEATVQESDNQDASAFFSGDGAAGKHAPARFSLPDTAYFKPTSVVASRACNEKEDEDILLSFLQPYSESQVRDRWERRKAELTHDYKRRHREAVKKKKRKVEGLVGSAA